MNGVLNIFSMKMILTLCLMLAQVLVTESILCYQCADSSSNKKTATCLHSTHNLQRMRMIYEQQGVIDSARLPHIKNCSKYNMDYCKIETVESFGQYTAYIRDCSNGSSTSFQKISKLQVIKPDNQTTCAFSSLQGATICISVCNDPLCNGPLNMGNYVSVSFITMLFLSIIGALLVSQC